MSLLKTSTRILNQLADLIHQIEGSDYTRSAEVLSGSTIGQHVRHTLEFFSCFKAGFHQGLINYDQRSRDKVLENDKARALEAIQDSLVFMSTITENHSLKLEVGYEIETDERISVETNVMRELVYNIEHAVHHMAIIRIGIREVAPYVRLDSEFGVAASTIRLDLAHTRTSDNY